MRLDKFLKVSRLIKRRTIAKEACDAGRVRINENVAKAGTQVEVGDDLRIDFGNRELVVRVVDIRQHVPAKQAAELYEVTEEIRKERM